MELLLILGILFVLFAIGHLLYMINTRRLPRKAMYWFWVILALPVLGAVIYFTYSVSNRPGTYFSGQNEKNN